MCLEMNRYRHLYEDLRPPGNQSQHNATQQTRPYKPTLNLYPKLPEDEGGPQAVRRKPKRVGLRAQRYVFASIQTFQIAATEMPRRTIQSRVPPPVENILSLPAISRASIPKAP